MKNDLIIDAEYLLAQSCDRKYATLVGNGTTAIYLSFLSQGFINKRIGIPNNVCMNVLLPIYFSKNIPVFLDIETDTMGIDINKLRKEKVDVVIAVHSYGNICNIIEINDYCKLNNIFLIEDAALSQGISYCNEPTGSFGDISILSFGSAKVIDIGHGGAVLTNDKTTYNDIQVNLKRLKNFSLIDYEKMGVISKEYKKLYNIDFGESFNTHSKKFKMMCLKNRTHFLYKFDNKFAELLVNSLNNIELLVKNRLNNVDFLYDSLTDIVGTKIIRPVNGSSYWRFNLFIDKYRNELFRYLLDEKYLISSWYHPIDVLFEQNKMNDTPIVNEVGGKIINIFVNENIDDDYLEKISDDIKLFLGQMYGSELNDE